jgi:hypothetical protein
MEKAPDVKTFRRWTARERECVIERYRASGKTQRAFCKEAGISLGSLTNWLRERRGVSDEHRTGKLIEVALPSESTGCIEVALSGIIVRIPSGTSPEWAATLITLLRCGA